MKAAYTRIKKPRRVTDDPVIYVCSPYAADPERNARRAENFCRYVWEMGGIPLAPHLLFPRFMNENRNKEREAGLRMARKLLGMCDEMWVFGDEISEGMVGEIVEASSRSIPIYHYNGHYPDHRPRRERPESLVVAYLTSRRKTQWQENA